MSCYLKNIPANLTVSSGNRGIEFPYNYCDLPDQETCYLAIRDNEGKIAIEQQTGDSILLRCIE
jgi:hypothetical protein